MSCSKSIRSSQGFTLMEMMAALTVGLLLVAAATQLYVKGLNATFSISEKAQMQQDIRAAENLITRDISMAGAGLQPGGVALPIGGTSVNTLYGCGQSSCYLGGSPASGVAYPNRYMNWIVPGPGMGATINAGMGATDAITVVYGDTGFGWEDYSITLNSGATTATFTQVASPPVTPVKKVSDQAAGLKTGDLVLFTGSVGGTIKMAVGEVTADVTGTSSPYSVTFASPGKLKFNQTTGTTAGSMLQLVGGTGITAIRIYAISYYIDAPTGVAPRLMRQVNAQTAVPVAENVVDMQFSYSLYDEDLQSLTVTNAPTTTAYNLIQKVNIDHLTARTSIRGTDNFQSLDLQTQVAARNMSFHDRYQ